MKRPSFQNVKVALQLGELLHQRRMELGLSIYQLAKVTGVDATMITRMERGLIKKPTFVDIVYMTHYLALPLSVLLDITLKEDDTPQAPPLAPLPNREKLTKLVETIIEATDDDALSFIIVLLQAFLKHLHYTRREEAL